MNQSALVGGALLAGFVLFITARDRLVTYGAVLWGAKPAAPVAGTATTTTPAPGAANSPSSGGSSILPTLPDLSGVLGPLGTTSHIGYDLGGFLGGAVH